MVECVEYARAELLLRVLVRVQAEPRAGLAPALLIEYREVQFSYSPIVACWSGARTDEAAPRSDDREWRWRGTFQVPPDIALDSSACFALRLHGDLVFELTAPVERTSAGDESARRRPWGSAGRKPVRRGTMMLCLAAALVLGPEGGSAGALAAGAGAVTTGAGFPRVSGVASGSETTTTSTLQTTAAEESSTTPTEQEVTSTSASEEAKPEQPSTTTSATPQTLSPEAQPSPPAGEAAAPAQPKNASTVPASSQPRTHKTNRTNAGGATASPQPAVAEPQGEPVAAPATLADAEVLSPQLAELTGLLGGSEDAPPASLIPIYEAAGRRYDVPWRVLAAINAVETDYGRDLSVSPAGAVGWMQFMPETWAQWAVDADDDGEKNPYSPQDAIFTAARYLQASGAEHNLPGAIFAYNHAGWYVTEVLLRARLLANVASFASLEKGYSLPLDKRYMKTLGRTDDGVDIETAPDDALVYSMTPGVVTAIASDPAGFGPNYPVVHATAGSLAGQNVYYGHVAVALVHTGEVVAAGQPIAIMGHTGDAASLGHGHIEIGFSDAGGDPLSHHGAGAWTPAGDLMRAFLVALSSSFGVHNE